MKRKLYTCGCMMYVESTCVEHIIIYIYVYVYINSHDFFIVGGSIWVHFISMCICRHQDATCLGEHHLGPGSPSRPNFAHW